MTLNRVIAVILRYSTQFSSYEANNMKVVEERQTLSGKKM